MKAPFRFSRDGEPSGKWYGIPGVGTRWKVGGKVYVLTDIQLGYGGIRLEYQPLGSWEAGRLIDPHADCRRRHRLPFLRRLNRRPGYLPSGWPEDGDAT
jgi:hypothetical protein